VRNVTSVGSGRACVLIGWTVLVLSFTCLPAFSAELHVGPGRTYARIADAIAASSGGDTIVIHQGTYNEHALKPKTGIDSAHRTILRKADGEDMPVIDGGFTSYQSTWDNATIFIGYGASRNHIELDGLIIQNGSRAGVVLYDGGVDDVVIKNCEIRMDWGDGQYAADNAGCIVVSPNATNIQILNNLLVSRSSGVHGVIGFKGDGSWKVANNEIDIDCDGAGGKDCNGVFWKHGGSAQHQAVVENNLVHTRGPASNNGGIWIVNDNTLIRNNLVYGAMKRGLLLYGSMGVRGGSNCQVDHNTVQGGQRNGVMYEDGAGGVNNRFTNNIVSGNATEYQAFGIWVYGSGTHNTQTDYNLYYNSASSTPIKEFRTSYGLASWQGHSGMDAHSVSADPRFVDLAGGDMQLAAGSPARGRASDGKDLGADFSNLGRSSGAEPDAPPAAPVGLSVSVP